MSRKHEKSRGTTYNEIFMYKNGALDRALDNGTVMVDNKAIYVGDKGNWRFSWKSISSLELEGRESLKIACKDDEIRIECWDNAAQDFYDFKEFLLKIWNKRQGKKEAKVAMVQQPPKKRRSYGGSRKYAKPVVAPRYYYSSEDENDAAGKDEKEQEQSSLWKELPEPGDEEEEFEDETKLPVENDEIPTKPPAENDENQTPHVQKMAKRLKGKRRLQKKSLSDKNDDNDSDDDILLDDPGVTTPKRSNRLVSPMNEDDDEKEKPSSASPVQEAPPKGTQSITNFFAPKAATKNKAVAKAPGTTSAAELVDEPKNPPTLTTSLNVVKSPLFNKSEASPFPTKPFSSPARPLKNDNSEWLTTARPSATKSPARSRYFPLSSRKYQDHEDDTDIESPSATPPRQQAFFESNRKRLAIEEEDGIQNSPPSARKLFASTSGIKRRTFRGFRHRPQPSLQPASSPAKRSLADDVLSTVHTPVKTIRLQHPNVYLKKRKRIAPIPLEGEEVPTKKTPWRGIRNLGNTCFLNASLQMLFSVPDFVSSLTDKGKDLAKSIVSVSSNVKNTEPIRAANPAQVKSAIDAVTDKFQGYEQRDAHEFLSDLVDRVHDELEEEQKEKDENSDGTKETAVENAKESELVAGPSAATSTTTQEKSGDKAADAPTDEKETKGSSVETAEDLPLLPTDEYFRMNVQVCLTCDSCGYARTMEEMYRHLSIDVENENADAQEGKPSEWSVQKGLDQFFAPETREIRCEKCADGITATQTLRILSRPKALLLHLKRFVLAEKPTIQVAGCETNENADENTEPAPKRKAAVEMIIRKNKAPVDLNPTVSLGPIVEREANKENDKDGPMATFDVKSVVHHIGSTAWSGHYTCDAIRESEPKTATSPSKESAQTWVSFDDGITSETTADRVLNSEKSRRTAYMLLYTLK